MKKRLTQLALLSFLMPALAWANSNCDKPRNDFDGLYCLNKIYQQADTELNVNYKTLVPLLDQAGKAALKHRQLQWMRERNQDCSMHQSGGFYVNLECATSTTIERAQFLQDRIRECKSAGCLNSRLQ